MTDKIDSPEHRKTLVETIKEHIPNPGEMIIDQIIHMFIQWYNRRILILSSLIMIGIPIYMISIGLSFFHSCPKSFYLPLHMIICGITSFIAAILLISISIIWKKAIKLPSKIKYHTAPMILSFSEIIIILICLFGLILLTIILVRISNTVELIHRTSDFCHPILYYSSYVLLFLINTILSIIMIILFLIFYAYQTTQ